MALGFLNKMLMFIWLCWCTVGITPTWGRPQAQRSEPAEQLQAHPQNASAVSPIPIVSQSESVGADGSFNFSYETGNGIHVEEGGYIKKVQLPQGQDVNNTGRAAGDENVQVITGAFSYTAPDGTQISLRYTADENGFHPEGSHLPTPPPIPPEIQKSLGITPNKTEVQRSVEYPRDYVDASQYNPTYVPEEHSEYPTQE